MGAKGKATPPSAKGRDEKYVTVRIKKSLLWGAFYAFLAILVAVGVPKMFEHSANRQVSENRFSPDANVDKMEVVRQMQKDNVYKFPAVGVNDDHPDKGVRGLPFDLSNWPYGALGLGVDVDDSLLPLEELEKKREMFQNHAFNEYVSELIPLNRSLPDFRPQWCKDTYDHLPVSDLKPVSVIICFHNEAWSTLLRSVHSVINRTPEHLVGEILLVDDKSVFPHLGQRLDDYVRETFTSGKVKVIRQEKRQGLMRSRMVGIRAARTDTVLVFLDSHIEAAIGWLEPLLAGIRDNPKLIISPQIDAITDDTLLYRYVAKDLVGMVNWNLDFEWHELPKNEKLKKPNPFAPHYTAVMAGGLFAVSREFFQALGYYDEDMDVWGGENFELSFKAWMCGGRIEISPCSHVGHIFRTWSPYRVQSTDVDKNKIRAAAVWMDEFANLFFHRLGKAGQRMGDRLGNFGDITQRQQLRRELRCNNFNWYMKNIATMLPFHTLRAAGEVKNPALNLCVDMDDHMKNMDKPVQLLSCHGDNGFQYWWFNTNNFWLRDYMCVGVAKDKTVIVTDCGRSEKWLYDQRNNRVTTSKRECLTARSKDGDQFDYEAVVQECVDGDERQIWTLGQYNKLGLSYSELIRN